MQATARAETAYMGALDVARAQRSKSLELRVATSLPRFWESQGKEDEARDLLAPVYDWFAEGHETRDLEAVGKLFLSRGEPRSAVQHASLLTITRDIAA